MNQAVSKSTEASPTKPAPVIRWLNALECNNGKTYWITYIVAFLIMFGLMGLFYFIQDKTFIWTGDGLPQQYTSFIQLGNTYREILEGISSGNLSIPMFSSDVAYGNDTLLSLSSYFSNPLYLISIFATPENADMVLCSTVIVTLFLSGIFFTLFARNHSSNGWAILIGCMVYVFSGFTVTALYQIHMIYPLMMGPLIFLGAELVFQHRSPVLLPVAMALLMMNAIDMAYDCCILLFVYCVARFFSLPEKPSMRSFAIWFVKFFGLIVLAVCISAVIFLPCAYDLLNQDRVGLERPSNLFYTLSYYYRLWSGFIGFSYIGSESFYGFFPVGLLAVLALLVAKKGKQRVMLIALFVILTIILLFPALGKAMNGFAYPNNRWSWIYSLLIGYITVVALPSLFELSSRQRRSLLVLAAIYIVVSLAFCAVHLELNFLCAVIVFAVLAICFMILKKHPDMLRLILTGSVLISCGTTYWLWAAYADLTRTQEHTSPGEAYNLMVSESPNSLMQEIEGDDWRYDVSSVTILRNSPIAVGKNGVTFYNSFYNNAIDELNSELGLTSAAYNISLSNLDHRLLLYNLGGIRYLLTTADIAANASGSSDERIIPIGYDDAVLTDRVGDGEYAVLEADSLLPLAFAYDQGCSQESVASLSPIQKQNVMGIDTILDTGTNQDEPNQIPAFSNYAELDRICQNTPYTAKIACQNGEESEFLTKRDFVVPEGGADIVISTKIPSGKRAYLQIEHLARHENNRIMGIRSKETSFNVKVSSGAFSTTILQTLPSFSLYSGKDTWAVNLGVSATERNQIVAHFSLPGTYSIDDLLVTLEDEEAVLDNLKKLGEHAANDIVFEGNTLTCSIDVPETDAETASDGQKYLFVRLPYSKGWHAAVDGAEADIIKANYGFMAIGIGADEIGSGEHAIAFTYETPYLRAGALLSVLGIAALIALAIIYRKASSSAR